MIAEDQSVYGGTHVCTIKNVFANRGIGAQGFTASISGPGTVGPGETEMWSASTACTSGTVTYQWHYQPDGSSTWYSLGTSQNVTTSFSDSATLRVTATNNGQVAIGTKYIYVNTCPPPEIFCKQVAAEEQLEANTLQATALPTSFTLEGNYPNPFNPTTEIRYGLPEAAPVRLTIYDLTGREIVRLVDGQQAAGYHRIRWEAAGVPSGVYLYRLEAGPYTETQRMVLLK